MTCGCGSGNFARKRSRRRRPTKLAQLDKLQSNKPVVDASNFKVGKVMKGRNGSQKYRVVTMAHPAGKSTRVKRWQRIR